MMSTSRPIAASLLAAAALLLTACTAPAPAPPADTPQPSPTPSAIADPAPAPESVFDLDCADLVPEDAVAALFPTPVAPLNEPTPDLNTPGQIWRGLGVQQLGGLGCVWGDGMAAYPQPGVPDPNARALQVIVLPDASEGWETYSSYYAPGSDRSESCSTPAYCSIESFVGDAWIEVVATNPTDAASAVALHEAVATRIAEAPRRELSWQPPADGISPPTACEGLLTPEQLAAAVEWPADLFAERFSGGWSLAATTWEMLPTEPCSYTVGYSDTGAGQLNWLPGGEWAWRVAVDGGDAVPLKAPVDRDAASLSCGETDCVLDVLVAGTWVRLLLWNDLADVAPFADPPVEYGPSRSIEQMAAELAAAIVTNIRG